MYCQSYNYVDMFWHRDDLTHINTIHGTVKKAFANIRKYLTKCFQLHFGMLPKNFACLLILLMVTSVAQAQKTFKNPILSGFHPAPSLCRVGDDYYMATSSFEWFPGLPVYCSKDLHSPLSALSSGCTEAATGKRVKIRPISSGLSIAEDRIHSIIRIE